jgi:hypothetical protein
MSISSEDAKAILAPHISSLQSCVVSGLDEYNRHYGPIRHVHSPHARAMIIRDHIIFSVKKEFDEVSGVRILNKRGLFLLLINEKLLLRFKKLNNRMLARNYPTKQARKFSEQLSFDGFFVPVTNINVGYIANDLFTSPEKVVVACPNSMSSNEWCIDITPDGLIQDVPVIPVLERDNTSNKPRVRVKVAKKRTGTFGKE